MPRTRKLRNKSKRRNRKTRGGGKVQTQRSNSTRKDQYIKRRINSQSVAPPKENNPWKPLSTIGQSYRKVSTFNLPKNRVNPLGNYLERHNSANTYNGAVVSPLHANRNELNGAIQDARIYSQGHKKASMIYVLRLFDPENELTKEGIETAMKTMYKLSQSILAKKDCEEILRDMTSINLAWMTIMSITEQYGKTVNLPVSYSEAKGEFEQFNDELLQRREEFEKACQEEKVDEIKKRDILSRYNDAIQYLYAMFTDNHAMMKEITSRQKLEQFKFNEN